jgi:hypothetical protein
MFSKQLKLSNCRNKIEVAKKKPLTAEQQQQLQSTYDNSTEPNQKQIRSSRIIPNVHLECYLIGRETFTPHSPAI